MDVAELDTPPPSAQRTVGSSADEFEVRVQMGSYWQEAGGFAVDINFTVTTFGEWQSICVKLYFILFKQILYAPMK